MSVAEPITHPFEVTATGRNRAVKVSNELLDLGVFNYFDISEMAFAEKINVGPTSIPLPTAMSGRPALRSSNTTLRVNITTEYPNWRGTKQLGLSVGNLDRFYEELPSDVETLSELQMSATANENPNAGDVTIGGVRQHRS